MKSDFDVGREALIHFHNRAVHYPENYQLTMEELVAYILSQNSMAIDSIGLGIINTEMSDSDVREAMVSLADQGEGRLPENWIVYTQALSNQLQNVSFIDAIKYTATQSTKDIVKGAQEAGNTAITTLKGINFLFPAVIIGGLLYISFFKIKKWSK